MYSKIMIFNPLHAKLNPICHLLALLGSHHIHHVSRIRVKNGGKLKATEKQRMNGQNTEVVGKFNYLVVMLESIAGWNKQKTLGTVMCTMRL